MTTRASGLTAVGMVVCLGAAAVLAGCGGVEAPAAGAPPREPSPTTRTVFGVDFDTSDAAAMEVLKTMGLANEALELTHPPEFAHAMRAQGSEEALAPAAPQHGITYHGGPVMLGTTNVYFIFYGNWAGSPSSWILTDFVDHLSGSGYYGINTDYYQPGHHVSNSIAVRKWAVDGYPYGQTNVDPRAIVALNLYTGQLPTDANGLYVIFTAPDVSVYDPSNHYSYPAHGVCAWHGAVGNLKYAVVPNVAGNYWGQSACVASNIRYPHRAPNDLTTDAMANLLAHETNEAVTDPHGNAWFTTAAENGGISGEEVGDLCAWDFGTSANANIVLGTRRYLIQANYLGTNPWRYGYSLGHCAL